jgi:glucosamine--fructose-6-phosphate aminotransferase (isomerizing)
MKPYTLICFCRYICCQVISRIVESVFPSFLMYDVYFGVSPSTIRKKSIVFFPLQENTLCCGLTGIVSVRNKEKSLKEVDIGFFTQLLKKMEDKGLSSCRKKDLLFDESYLGGQEIIDSMFESARALKENEPFVEIFQKNQIYVDLKELCEGIGANIEVEAKQLSDYLGRLSSKDVDVISKRIEELRDIRWCLEAELTENVVKIKKLINIDLADMCPSHILPSKVSIFKEINSVLNSIDRLEVRGRDSSGISLMFILKSEEFEKFKTALTDSIGENQFDNRMHNSVLINNSITMGETKDETGTDLTTLTIVYKVAAEVGSLGDNIKFLRQQIIDDSIIQILTNFSMAFYTVSAHTRWASVGAITEENCHPVDNETDNGYMGKSPIIHACLNGDIDNYLELKKEFEDRGNSIPAAITTDTKIIPIQVEKYIHEGNDPEEAFRLAVNDFQGSHAISMHTDLAPGKLFLAQRGSGQAIFVGISKDHYMPTSEVYGFIETTPFFLKMDGEKVIEGKNGNTNGQIIILDQKSSGRLDGIKASYYDGTPIELCEDDIKNTEITSRDIDRQDFPHYFLKEISESPASVEKTLLNRWKVKDNNSTYEIVLDESSVPKTLKKALGEGRIKRIFFIGQGTAGVAAGACADIMGFYLDDRNFNVSSLRSSELSGFKLSGHDDATSMSDTLVVAISQSGTTTDTNRTVDMIRERGAHTLAIVNRRDSDITFKVDGVIYTSTGRDVEMSVASTKAFYSQIVAGAILGLYIADLLGKKDDLFITEEINNLLALPSQMRTILTMGDKIKKSAQKLAVKKMYWAAVGSGPNKASADEIRIKLSELCYKTISTDFVEDKKHIDLSSEPLIIVCAAGTRESVLGDIIKDTAIFHAHKASPVVIANQGEQRFNPYARDVFHVPSVSEHLAPIVNTLVGHLWGYYAALAINDASGFMYKHRKEIQATVDTCAKEGLDVYEIVLEDSFREKIAVFYREFRSKRIDKSLPAILGFNAASDLTLLLKYLSGRLPVSDFEMDFGKKGTALNMLNSLLECLSESISAMARPVDAIKHQAKTVTVGTSRISEKVEGVLFDALLEHNLKVSQLTNQNVIVLRNLQGVVSGIMGSILYRIDNLNLLGEPTKETTIKVIKKQGALEPIPSRVETDFSLKGTKKIILSDCNVYIGKGRKDDRSIVVIPVISSSSSAPNMIGNMLLLNISFKENIKLQVKRKALGGKYEHIKNITQENSVPWNDSFLELVETDDLFGSSAEKIAEFIVFQKRVKGAK